MTKTEIFFKKSPIYSALILERYFSARKRNWIMTISKYLLLSIPLIIIVSIILKSYGLFASQALTDQLIRKLFGFR
jgi:hypothetical protein